MVHFISTGADDEKRRHRYQAIDQQGELPRYQEGMKFCRTCRKKYGEATKQRFCNQCGYILATRPKKRAKWFRDWRDTKQI